MIEVMAATCILATATVLIYGSLFKALDSYNFCVNYLQIAPLADETIWQAQDNLCRFASLNGLAQGGEFVSNSRRFGWGLSAAQVEGKKEEFKLFNIDLTYYWREGKTDMSLSRNAYAFYEKPKQPPAQE
jgi:hypothetical protein